MYVVVACCVCLYFFVNVISMVETILPFVSPSLGGISSVPMAILLTFSSFMKRFLTISATSTAVVMDLPRAFNVISLALDVEMLVMVART